MLTPHCGIRPFHSHLIPTVYHLRLANRNRVWQKTKKKCSQKYLINGKLYLKQFKRFSVPDYGSNSSLHGVGYLLDPQSRSGHRVLWVLVFFTSLALAISLTHQSYVHWQENQVEPGLRDRNKTRRCPCCLKSVLCANRFICNCI